MISTEVALLGFADSFNLLLWAIIIFGTIRNQSAKKLTLLVTSDWVGILSAAYLILLAFNTLGIDAPQTTESPWLGILLAILGVLGLLTINKSGSIVTRSIDFSNKIFRSRTRIVGGGVALGFVQSLTSVPFIGGVLSLINSENGSSFTASMIIYSLIAISTSLVILAAGIALKGRLASIRISPRMTSLVTSVLLILVGAVLAINS